LKKNLLRVQYDPEKVTPEAMQEKVAGLEFKATIVPDKG